MPVDYEDFEENEYGTGDSVPRRQLGDTKKPPKPYERYPTRKPGPQIAPRQEPPLSNIINPDENQ